LLYIFYVIFDAHRSLKPRTRLAPYRKRR